MNHAFDGGEFHSLVGNLSSADEAMWQTPLPGSLRTIGEIALHVGSSKVMYENYAFGSATLSWEDPAVEPWPPQEAPIVDAIRWLR